MKFRMYCRTTLLRALCTTLSSQSLGQKWILSKNVCVAREVGKGGFGLVVRLAFKMQNGSALGHVLFCS